MTARTAAGYLPVGAYALIGDCRSAALVGDDGSIDWLALPRFDDSSLFARILDARQGGYWQLRPVDRHTAVQGYRDRSNLLRTVYTTAAGSVSVVDFMPVSATTIGDHAHPHNDARVVRLIEGLSGEVTLENTFFPAPDYARSRITISATDGHLHGDAGGHHYCLQSTIPLRRRQQRFVVHAGETVALGLRCGRAGHCAKRTWSVAHAQHLARDSQEFWWRWIGQCTYAGPFQEHVWRSALTLKLLTYAPTGAIIAAPTTSLPERVGSYHNYDYRFTWLRDAAFTLYAFFQMGFLDEAEAFFRWLRDIGLDCAAHDIPNLYTLDGSGDITEELLTHLSGYRGSRPVRIGNAAVNQLQLDIYGELLDSAYLYVRFGGRISASMWRDLRPVVDLACQRWTEPDRSIWEPRDGDRHYTYSKLMCWVAVDRGIRIADRFHLPHDAATWRAARRSIHRTITTRGWNARLGAFTQTLDGDSLDAALLRISQTRFLPDSDARMTSTVAAIAEGLSDGGVLVRRFLRGPHDGGRHPVEGAFLMCSFWLVDALAHVGRLEEAENLFERLLGLASPLGLYAEEADAVNGQPLGNYPQAFTHLALVGAAVNIERARHGTLGRRGLRGRRPATGHDDVGRRAATDVPRRGKPR